MSKADATDPNVIDNMLVDCGSDHHSAPVIVPDHGRQPRPPKRPTLVVYKSDPHNGRHLYRPVDDPYRMSLDEGAEYDDRRYSKERKIVQLLTDTARYHAPKLSRRRESMVEDTMEREGIMSAARFIAGELPLDARSRVLATFTSILRDEVARHRKNRRITKI
jgi:hypothetical protein